MGQLSQWKTPCAVFLFCAARAITLTGTAQSALIGQNLPLNAITITSLGPTSVQPFDVLTVNGTGFSPLNSAISVVLIPENGNPQMTIPAFEVSSTSLQIVVPPVFDDASQSFLSGKVGVQVVQFTGTAMAISNQITGLQIRTLPAVPQDLPAGAITAAFLTTAVNVSSALQAATQSQPALGQFAAALAGYSTHVGALISAINAVVSNPGGTFTIPGANGTTISLNAATLQLSDQMMLAWMTHLARQGQIAAQQTSHFQPDLGPTSRAVSSAATTSCPDSVKNSSVDSLACLLQTFFQNVTGVNPVLQQDSEKFLVGSA